MRNVSTASLAKLATRLGTEPVCIVEIQWQVDGPTTLYSDKAVEGMEGRIIQLAGMEDVINVSKSGTSQSMDITLDDTDGALKEIFNNTDIHKKKVSVYQWFTGIPLTDKILLFVGLIASPVMWKEGDRTLSFSVISRSEDNEVGFSPEEGSFPSVPQNLIGTVWPIVFGTVKKLPGILVDNIPYSDSAGGSSGDGAGSVTKDGTGIKDPSLDHRIDDNDKNANGASAIAQAYFIGYLLASFTARKRGELDEFDNISRGKGHFSGLAKNFLQQGNAKLKEAQKIRAKNETLRTVKQAQEANQKDKIGVTNGELFEQNKTTKINLNGAVHTGRFIGSDFVIDDRQHPQAEQYEGMTVEDLGPDRQGTPVIPRQNYFWADAGQPLRIGILSNQTSEEEQNDPNMPIRYIVSSTIPTSVDAIFAYRTIGDTKQLVAVPSNYYYVFQEDFGSLPVTLVWMPHPLSSRMQPNGQTEGWEDEIWISCRSLVGPNTVDILVWLIQTYTGRTYDTASFVQVAAYVDPYPMHFAVTDRPNVLSLIQQIAYQARCVVWLKNDIFYIKYLAKEEDPVDEINEDDIIEQSMEVSYTETEDLVTKYIAEWHADYKMSKQFKIILRYNVLYYGLIPKTYNFFCFNMQSLVEKAATFWLIREANTFKILKIKVPISKLNIETLDTVTMNFSGRYIADGPVDCVVQESKLDTADYTVELTLWVPVRAGEMTKYLFAYMGDLDVGYYFPTEDDIKKGRVAGANKTLPVHEPAPNKNVQMPERQPGPNMSVEFTGDKGNGGQVRTTDRPPTWGADPTIQNDFAQIAPTIIQRIDTSTINNTGRKPAGTTRYKYDQQDVKNEFKPEVIYPRSYPGYVVQADGTFAGKRTYQVRVYQEGLGATVKVVNNVVFTGPTQQTLEAGSGVIVNEVFLTKDDDSTDIQYYLQGSQGGTGRTFPGKIISGTGEEYQVELYRYGTEEASDTVTAFQLQIDGTETIPVDTWVPVNELIIPDDAAEGGARQEYYIQVPVWL